MIYRIKLVSNKQTKYNTYYQLTDIEPYSYHCSWRKQV